MSRKFAESDVEEAALAWLESVGRSIRHGVEIVSDPSSPSTSGTCFGRGSWNLGQHVQNLHKFKPRKTGPSPGKRIGSFLFMLYLKQEGAMHRFNPQALTALALLIAESAPANKDLMIRLIINLLAGHQP